MNREIVPILGRQTVDNGERLDCANSVSECLFIRSRARMTRIYASPAPFSLSGLQGRVLGFGAVNDLHAVRRRRQRFGPPPRAAPHPALCQKAAQRRQAKAKYARESAALSRRFRRRPQRARNPIQRLSVLRAAAESERQQRPRRTRRASAAPPSRGAVLRVFRRCQPTLFSA